VVDSVDSFAAYLTVASRPLRPLFITAATSASFYAVAAVTGGRSRSVTLRPLGPQCVEELLLGAARLTNSSRKLGSTITGSRSHGSPSRAPLLLGVS
jgi:hypothetical protein